MEFDETELKLVKEKKLFPEKGKYLALSMTAAKYIILRCNKLI